uniref:WAP domain-containing protein n=1 Tax=Zonotrichia albicollis TaxID=44394 RepID=A0A8D2MAX4_ZONAL
VTDLLPRRRATLLTVGLNYLETDPAMFFSLSEKPGTCPPVNPGIPMLGVCSNQCKTDANCAGIQKCCRNGCGKVSCVTPIQ